MCPFITWDKMMNHWIFLGPGLCVKTPDVHHSWRREKFHDRPPLESEQRNINTVVQHNNFRQQNLAFPLAIILQLNILLEVWNISKLFSLKFSISQFTCFELQRLTEFFKNLWWLTKFFMWAPRSFLSISLKTYFFWKCWNIVNIYLMSPIITLTKAYSIRLRNTKNVQEDINMSMA